MSNELRPCPFCGGKPELIYLENYGYCYCCGDTHIGTHYCETGNNKTEAEAVETWNHRPAEDALTAEIERMKEEIEKLTGYVKQFQETLAEVAHLAINAEQEQIFEKCRNTLRDVYLEEKFRDSFDKILHNPDTNVGTAEENK